MKTALVTGASRGLGADMAAALARAGWGVAVNCKSDSKSAGQIVERIESSGGRSIVAQFDVTDEISTQAGVAQIASRLGPVDLIVNNATGPQPLLPIEEQRWEHYQAQIDFFLKAPLFLLQAVLSDWRKRRTGRIINIGSEVVEIGNPNFAHYVAAKAAMIGLTRSWATELGADGITVNLVAPGFIPVERHADVDRDTRERYRSLVPLSRLGNPKDISGLVVFLASESADFITGQTFTANGGRIFH